MPFSRRQMILVALAVAIVTTSSSRAEVSPSGENEVMLTMASLAIQTKDYTGARRILNELLKKDSKNNGARELLALTQERMDEPDAAAKTYEQLIANSAPEKAAAYHFQLAVLKYKKKDTSGSRPHFDFAAKNNFNAGTANFYLGVMDFNAKDWRTARHHFSASLTYNDAKSMAPVARYYLANSYLQIGNSDAAVHNYYEVKEQTDAAAANGSIDDMLKGIRTNVLKELKDLDKNSRYVTVSLLQGFDSNVQANPSEVNNPIAAAGQRSAKATLVAAAGYTTSPTQKIQIAPSFSYSTNYNYNYLARTFDFMSFAPGVIAMYKPYERLSAGLKADGIFSMQNMLDATESQRDLKYRPFSLTGDLGAIVKYELTPRINLAAENYFRPTRFYLDQATGDDRRSGGGTFHKLSADFVSGYTWWNPTAYISFEWVHSAGLNFRSYNWGGGLADTVSVTEKLAITGSWDIVSSDYSATVPHRQDTNMIFKVATSYPIVDHWSASADIAYTDNDSSISTVYKYNRWSGDLGGTYSF